MKNFRSTQVKSIMMSLVLLLGIMNPMSVSATDIYMHKNDAIGELPMDEYLSQELSQEEMPEVIDDQVIQENHHVQRLYSQEEDLYSAVFQNGDDSQTMYYFGYPIKYVAEDGSVQDKSNKIEHREGLSWGSKSYSYYTPGNDIKSLFPDMIGGDTCVTVAADQYEISFRPVNGQTVKAKLISEKRSSLQYEDAFGEGYSLIYQPQFDGLKEEIVIREDKGTYRFCFLLALQGLHAEAQENHVFLKAVDGSVVGEISDVVLYDSAENPNISLNSTIALTSTEKEGTYLYTVTVDSSYMKNDNIVYPVYIDPSITINGSGSGSEKTILDTPVYSGVPTSCQGGNTYNVIGNANAVSSSYGVGRILMKFPGLMSNAIFRGTMQSQVTSMKLYLYFSSGSVSSSTAYVNLYTGAAWNETSTAYNNVSWSGYGTLLASASISSGNQWVSFDIKNAVSTWQANLTTADKGIMIRNSNESGTSYAKTFCSTESDHKPYVSFTWSAAATSGITDGDIYYINNNSKYISAESSITITLAATTSSTSGTELWRFEQVQAGVYRIETLGVRNGVSGEVPYMLTTYASGQSTSGTMVLAAYNESDTRQWWHINRTNQGYTIINYACPQLAISISPNTGQPILSSAAYYSKWNLTPVAKSDYWSGGYSGATAPYTVNVIIRPSALSAHMTDALYDRCKNVWNGIDSNISVNLYQSTFVGTPESADLTVYVEGDPELTDCTGKMDPTPLDYNANWTEAKITLNTGNGRKGLEYELRGTIDREAVFLHELGHALKLKHPHESNSDWHPLSIMNQEVPNTCDYVPYRPSGYDKYNLSHKW